MSDHAIYSGGCACGAVRYSIPGPTLVELHCQCRHCQQRTGTGHGSYVIFGHRDRLRISGEVRTWSLPSDSGSLKTHAFCPECGAPVYVLLGDRPANICIHSGSLDDPELFEPQFVVYAARALSWDRLDPALPKHDAMRGEG